MRMGLILAAVALAWSAPALTAPANDTAAVQAVLSQYKAAIEKLDATGTEQLFTADSMMFETGSAAGSYANYLAQHLAPELKAFKSFKFNDYKASVRFLGPATALATESYSYRIETSKGEVAERLGVATSVLRKQGGRWRILMMHNSGRPPKAR